MKSLDRFSPKFLGANNFFLPQKSLEPPAFVSKFGLEATFFVETFPSAESFFQPGETWGMLLGDGSFGSFDMLKIAIFY